MTANYKDIRFVEILGVTVCRSNHGGAVLGRVKWVPRRREHVFVPEPYTGFGVESLCDIGDFIFQMNAERKGGK